MKIRWPWIAILVAPVVLAVPAHASQIRPTAAHQALAPLRAGTWPLGVDRAITNPNPATFTDTPNDGGSAPDILTVVVSNDAKGNYKIRINVSKLTLPSNVLVIIALDTDQNAATGTAGFDFAIVCDESNNSVGLLRWDGTQFVPASSPSLTASDDGGGVTITINRTDIGNAAAVNFAAQTLEGSGGAGHADFAPDSGTWSYELTEAAALQLTVSSFRAPKTVRAGKSFIVTLLVTRSDTGEFVNDEIGGAVSCLATVGGKRLRATAAGFVETTRPEQGACLWRAPKNAHGKNIRGSITISIDGVTAKKTFTIKVR